MKLASAVIVPFLRPALAALALLLLIGLTEEAAAHPLHRSLSRPLQDPKTHGAIREVSQHVSVKTIWIFYLFILLTVITKFVSDMLLVINLPSCVFCFQAQRKQPEEDTSSRLMPRVNTNQVTRFLHDARFYLKNLFVWTFGLSASSRTTWRSAASTPTSWTSTCTTSCITMTTSIPACTCWRPTSIEWARTCRFRAAWVFLFSLRKINSAKLLHLVFNYELF